MSWEVPKIQLSRPDTVLNAVQHLDDLRIKPERTTAKSRGLSASDDYGYECIDLKSLRFQSAGSVFVPGHGLLDMTGHARHQLGSELGVRWDKFFGRMGPDKIQRAVMDHLNALPEDEPTVKKVVAREYDKGEEQFTAAANGLLRGLVGPTYSDIRDARFLRRMRKVIGARRFNEEMAFAAVKLRDNGSHFMLVMREAINLRAAGKVTADPNKMAYLGMRCRNSEVGTFALSGMLWLLTYICSNGMISGVEEGPVFYRRHRYISDEDLDDILKTMWEALPKRHKEIVAKTTAALKVEVVDPSAELNRYLRGQPKWIHEAADKAMMEEGLEEGVASTAFDVAQVLARLAMAASADTDRQYELEQLAGSYLDRAAKRAA